MFRFFYPAWTTFFSVEGDLVMKLELVIETVSNIFERNQNEREIKHLFCYVLRD